MTDNRMAQPVSRSVRPMLALCAVGFSVVLPQAVAWAEAQAGSQVQFEASVTPSAQALSRQFRELEQQRCRLQIDCSPEQVTLAEVWAETELNYSNMERSTRAATSTPAIHVSENDERMYSGLSAPRFAFDEEAVPVNRTHIMIAELRAASAPPVVLDNEALQALASIQTSFPRSIEIDFGGE